MANKSFKITLTDKSDEVKAILEKRAPIILDSLGKDAVKFAVDNIKDIGYEDTGTARNSINYKVNDDTVYIGSNLKYFPYLELGTGVHASNGQGRKGWWVYVLDDDENYEKEEDKDEKRIYTEQEAKAIAAILRSKGLDAHATNGIKPGHMLRDAIADHEKDYKKRIEQGLEGIGANVS